MSLEKIKIVGVGSGSPSGDAKPALIEAVNLSGQAKPKVLIIPSAKRTQEAHDKTVSAANMLFAEELGLRTDVLHGFDVIPPRDELVHKINDADVVYVSGGDTDHMMGAWRRANITSELGQRATEGLLVMSGTSAGAIAPFRWGHSDSLSYRPEHVDDWDYVPVDGLDLINAAVTPHHDRSSPRLGKRSDSFKRMLADIAVAKGTSTGFGIDNTAAVVVEDGYLRPLSTKPNRHVHILNAETGFEPIILDSEDRVDIATL